MSSSFSSFSSFSECMFTYCNKAHHAKHQVINQIIITTCLHVVIITCFNVDMFVCLYVDMFVCNILLRQVLCKENGLEEMNKYTIKRNKIRV